MRLLIPLLLFTSAAHGQPWPTESNSSQLDEFSLEREWGAPYAFVEYYNSEYQMSAHFPRTLTAGDLTVQLELNITQGPEVLTVHPPPGWTVVGDATISVADGDRGYVELIRGGQGM
jgi:hypothetical protein